MDHLVGAGFVDTFRVAEPEAVKYSWWDMKTRARDRNVGWRIDYFFVNQAFLPRVKGTEYLNDVPGSDHCPVLLKIG